MIYSDFVIGLPISEDDMLYLLGLEDLFWPTERKNTTVRWAILNNNYAIIEFYLSNPHILADDLNDLVRVQQGILSLTLFLASMQRKTEWLDWLKDYLAKDDNKNILIDSSLTSTDDSATTEKKDIIFSILSLAAISGKAEHLGWLKDYFPDNVISNKEIITQSSPVLNGQSILHIAAQYGYIDFLQKLFTEKYTNRNLIKSAKNANNETVAQVAAKYGQVFFLDELVNRGLMCIETIKSQRILHMAAFSNQTTVVNWFFDLLTLAPDTTTIFHFPAHQKQDKEYKKFFKYPYKFFFKPLDGLNLVKKRTQHYYRNLKKHIDEINKLLQKKSIIKTLSAKVIKKIQQLSANDIERIRAQQPAPQHLQEKTIATIKLLTLDEIAIIRESIPIQTIRPKTELATAIQSIRNLLFTVHTNAYKKLNLLSTQNIALINSISCQDNIGLIKKSNAFFHCAQHHEDIVNCYLAWQDLQAAVSYCTDNKRSFDESGLMLAEMFLAGHFEVECPQEYQNNNISEREWRAIIAYQYVLPKSQSNSIITQLQERFDVILSGSKDFEAPQKIWLEKNLNAFKQYYLDEKPEDISIPERTILTSIIIQQQNWLIQQQKVQLQQVMEREAAAHKRKSETLPTKTLFDYGFFKHPKKKPRITIGPAITKPSGP